MREIINNPNIDLDPVSPAKSFDGKHRERRSRGHDPAVTKEDDFVGQYGGGIRVMRRQDNGLSFFPETIQDAQDPPGIGQVEMRDRFVQEKNLRILNQRPGDGGKLSLAGTESPDGFRRFPGQVDIGQRLLDRSSVFRTHPTQKVQIRRPSEEYIFPDAQFINGPFIGSHMADEAAALPAR